MIFFLNIFAINFFFCLGQMLLWARAILPILVEVIPRKSDRWKNKYVKCYITHILLLKRLLQYAYLDVMSIFTL